MIQFLVSFILFTIFYCSKPTEQSIPKNYKFGLPIAMQEVDTNDDKKIDAIGYYVDDPQNIRLVYQELDRNLDGLSDTMIWAGLHTASPKGRKEKQIVKVHEEEDKDNDGQIDTLRWLLPNDVIALEQQDKDKDGYFETTTYYNFKKEVVRTEKDTNFDGKSDISIWKGRAEIDSDFDGVFDKYVLSESNLELEAKISKKENLLDIPKGQSWFMNRELVPKENQAVIGGGM